MDCNMNCMECGDPTCDKYDNARAEYFREMSYVVDSLCKVDYDSVKIPIAVAYNKPNDFPNRIVLRLFDGQYATNLCALFHTLEDARRDARKAGFRQTLERSDGDDTNILEIYLF